MKIIYLFDVDGTLTEPRQAMTDAFAEFFSGFVQREHVFLVSGSDYEKLQQQVPQEILNASEGVFGCAGAQLIEQDQLIYEKTHSFSESLMKTVEAFIAESPYKTRCGNHIEHRPGMLNISVVGRAANPEQRKTYHAWDSGENERVKFADQFNQQFRDYEASCGGQISIDIVPKGWNKSVVKGEVLERFPGARLIFFGDRMGANGNDQPLADVLNTPSGRHRVIPVSSYKDTWLHLNHIKDALDADDLPFLKSAVWEGQSHETVQ